MAFDYRGPNASYNEGGLLVAPTDGGVYGIFDLNNKCIYVGSADNIRQRMEWHIRGWSDQSACIICHLPSYFTWETGKEIVGPISLRESELIVLYKRMIPPQAYCNTDAGL